MTGASPCARCGCTLMEHRMEVGSDWQWGPTRCLTCSDCEQFVAESEAAEAESNEAEP